MLKIARTAALGLIVLLVAAFNTRPLMNVENAGLSAPANVTMEQVEAAIRAGAAERGWELQRLAPGRLEATVYIRSHMAQVEILHDTSTFSIHYKNSSNLKYDGANIHRNYNNWISNLQRSIVKHTSMIQ